MLIGQEHGPAHCLKCVAFVRIALDKNEANSVDFSWDSFFPQSSQ